MKSFSLLVGCVSGALGVHLKESDTIHYADIPACTDKLTAGISTVADTILDIHQGTTAESVFGFLLDTDKAFNNVNEIATTCREVVEGKGEPPVEPKPIIVKMVSNSTTCISDIENLVADATQAAQDLTDALNTKSFAKILEVLKEVKKVENDIADCKADCTVPKVEAQVKRSQCAKAIDHVMHKIKNLHDDVRAVVHDQQVLRVLALEHEIMDIPDLATKVAEKCVAEVGMSGLLAKVENAKLQRRGIFDALHSLVDTASNAMSDMSNCAEECFSKVGAVAAHLTGVAGIAKQVGNMTNGYSHFHNVDDNMHQTVGDAIVACEHAKNRP